MKFRVARVVVAILAVVLVAGVLISSSGCSLFDKSAEKGSDKTGAPSVDATASAVEESKSKPVALGNTSSVGNWDVTVNSVSLDATDEIVDFDEFNTPPSEEGFIYVMANVTAKYNGEKETLIWGDLSYFFNTADGTAIESLSLLIPKDLMSDKTFKKGTEVTGNIAFEVPADAVEGGLLSFETYADGQTGSEFYRIK